MFSTLFRRKTVPTMNIDGILAADPRYFVVSDTLADGSVVLHGEPGAPVPADALEVFFDGATAWTWLQFAGGAHAALARASCTPHEWAGEPTADGVTAAQFPRLAPPTP